MISVLVAIFALAFFGSAHAADGSGGTLIPETRLGYAEADGRGFKSVCPNIRIDNEVDFGDMERRLLCGDGEQNATGIPWASIPPNQAAYFAKGFLQSRGFHVPRFIQDGDVLFIVRGPDSRLRDFKISGGPETWDPPKRRLIENERLTPPLLDDLQGWSLTQIKNEGYACATVESRADPATGEARVTVKPGSLLKIKRIEDTGDTGLREGALDRYNAFLIGDVYRERLISLTKRRIQDDGFLQTLVLTTRCDEDGVTLVRDIVLGPSRTVRIGVGGSTEEGARVRLIVRRNRIGESASSAQGRVNLSYLNEFVNKQIADASFRWYYLPGENRWFLEPAVIFEHAEETAFESQSVETKALHGWTIETTDGQFALRAGPNVLATYLSRGLGPERSTVTYAELGGRWTTHDFEWFATSPRTGEYVDASVLVTNAEWGANFTAQKLQIQGQKLWHLFHYDPPLFVLGVRFNASALFSPDANVTSDLPIRFLTFLGGESDLRGFDRQSLPLSGIGGLSSASGSIEGRFHKVLFKRVDVFTFLDGGALGRAQFKLDPPIFLSPGTGLRWESPLGVLRGYVAQRFVMDRQATGPDYDRAWRFGFTFGEEF
ncbi:MAG: BamA/TamA family outer membrane protein [Bdellovibrionota bacterium]